MSQALPTDVIDRLRRLVRERDLKHFFEQAASEAARVVGADGAALIEVIAPDELQYRFFRGLPADHQRMADGHRFSAKNSTAGAALKAGVPIFTADYPRHPNAMYTFVESGLKANLVVPCGPDGVGSAVLAIAWFSHYPSREPDEQALALIMLLADLMHSALYRQQLERHLEWQADHDMLTSLPNRRYLTGYMQRLFGIASRPRAPGRAVALLDLDDFKPINDRYGHLSGDCVLREVAMRMKEALGKADVVGRLGGDEFVLVLEPLPDERALDALMYSMCTILDRPYKIADGSWVHCSTSIGVAIDRGGRGTPESLMSNADRALYAAKRRKATRTARWEVYEPR